MIRATALTKRYGDRVAVDDAHFTVASGRVTGFLGPNGAGKSTTMRMVLGLDRPTRGAVTVTTPQTPPTPQTPHQPQQAPQGWGWSPSPNGKADVK